MKYVGLKTIALSFLICAVSSPAYASTSNEQDISYPKTMVVVSEYIDNNRQPAAAVSTQIESKFIEQKFDLVDRSQTNRLNVRDAELYAGEESNPIIGGTLSTKTSGDGQSNLINKAQFDMTKEASGTLYSFKDPVKLAILARGVGAEVLVMGIAVCNIKEASKPYGVSAYTYEAQISMKAVSTDNARVLAVETFRGTGRDSSRLTAADKALQAAMAEPLDPFVKKIASAWNGEGRSGTMIEVICYNATFNRSKELRKAIGTISDVKQVKERSLIDGVSELVVDVAGDPARFTDALSEIKSPKIEITSTGSGKVYIKFLP